MGIGDLDWDWGLSTWRIGLNNMNWGLGTFIIKKKGGLGLGLCSNSVALYDDFRDSTCLFKTSDTTQHFTVIIPIIPVKSTSIRLK